MEDIDFKFVRRIPEVTDEVVAYHLEHATRSLARTGKKIALFRDAEVWITDSPEINYLCLVKGEVILYMIRTKRSRDLLQEQYVLLVGNAKSEFTALIQGFTIFAFFKILIPKYNVLCSDKEQTVSGAKMYKGLLSAGLDRGLFVYSYSSKSLTNKVSQIRNSRTLEYFNSRHRRTVDGGERLALVLSNSEIKPTKQSVEIVEQ